MKKNARAAVIYTAAILGCLFPLFANGQISQGGTPLGYSNTNLSIVSFEIMPFVDNKKMIARDLKKAIKKNEAYRFGEKTDVDLSLNNSGSWQTLENGDRIWNLGIRSTGAKSINLIFNKYKLPDGARLFIYNEEKTNFIGSFDYRNNKIHGKLGTTLIPGEAIIIEYFEPESVKGLGEVSVGSVTHAYRDVFNVVNKSYGEADSCTININCPQGAAWQEQNSSVVMLLVGGWGFCSGTLVNNTATDGTPYVLTAEHCVGGDDGSTWIYLFNWESPTCSNSNPGMTQSVSSSIIRSKWFWSTSDNDATDFALFEMSSLPPLSYNPIYSGWTRSSTAATRYISISHPSADIKKWSEEAPSGTEPGYWWTVPVLNSGQTESGSSGCGVWNQNGLLVGQLWGGAGGCNDTTLINYWGRFDMSWDGNGTDSSRLKDWLDPNSTNVMSVNLFNPNITPTILTQTDKEEIIVYPNPSTGNISISTTEEIKKIEVFNLLGDLIYSTNLKEFDMPEGSSGMYLLSIGTSKRITVKKVIIIP